MNLKLENIQGYLAHWLKIIHPDIDGEEMTFTMDAAGCSSETISIDDVIIFDCKPILRKLELTKSITVNGVEIIPIVELYNLSQGIFGSKNYHRAEIMGTNWVCIDKSGHWLYNFQMHEVEADVRLGTCYGFKLFTTDLRCDNKKYVDVNNQNLLFKWLYANLYDVSGLIDAGLAIDADTLETNPYNS